MQPEHATALITTILILNLKKIKSAFALVPKALRLSSHARFRSAEPRMCWSAAAACTRSSLTRSVHLRSDRSSASSWISCSVSAELIIRQRVGGGGAPRSLLGCFFRPLLGSRSGEKRRERCDGALPTRIHSVLGSSGSTARPCRVKIRGPAAAGVRNASRRGRTQWIDGRVHLRWRGKEDGDDGSAKSSLDSNGEAFPPREALSLGLHCR